MYLRIYWSGPGNVNITSLEIRPSSRFVGVYSGVSTWGLKIDWGNMRICGAYAGVVRWGLKRGWKCIYTYVTIYNYI